LLVQDFFEFILLVSQLLASRGAINGCHEIVWLALPGRSRVVSLAFVGAVVVVSLAPVVVVALEEAVAFLVLLVGPSLHHVMELHDSLGIVAHHVAFEQLGGLHALPVHEPAM
jgi:hypothetical protein